MFDNLTGTRQGFIQSGACILLNGNSREKFRFNNNGRAVGNRNDNIGLFPRCSVHNPGLLCTEMLRPKRVLLAKRLS